MVRAFLSSSAEWFQVKWPPNWSSVNIATKELFPIVATTAIWGRFWPGKQVMFLSDNQAVEQALCTGSARDPSLSGAAASLCLSILRQCTTCRFPWAKPLRLRVAGPGSTMDQKVSCRSLQADSSPH